MKTQEIYTYIERLSTLLKNEQRRVGVQYGLQPVQLEALHYLNICNRYSDTPKGVTEYLGQTKGTVSQSLKVLEREGFISKHQDTEDKRIVHLQMTKEGKEALDAIIPPALFINACETLEGEQQEAISEQLKTLLSAIQKSNGLKTFGVCESCKHNKKDDKGQIYCDLTQEKLTLAETTLICLEHEVAERS